MKGQIIYCLSLISDEIMFRSNCSVRVNYIFISGSTRGVSSRLGNLLSNIGTVYFFVLIFFEMA